MLPLTAPSGCVASGLDHTDLVFSLTQAYRNFFVWTPIASYGAIRQKESWTLMASYGAERVNSQNPKAG